MSIQTSRQVGQGQTVKSLPSYKTRTRVSRGGIDEISPEDIVYGEYASDNGEKHGDYIDLVYLDGDILRTFSDYVNNHHPVIDELKILLRDDKKFYLIPIVEVKAGFAFKRTDIVDIKVSSVISGQPVSCIWTMRFEDKSIRTLEIDYQSYFAYGNTIRPNSMTNVDILDTVFPKRSR